MKRRGIIICLAVLVAVAAASAVFAAGSSSGGETDEGIAGPPFEGKCPWTEPVELTEEQKSEIADIHSQIVELRKEIVDKYQSYGAIDEETAEKIKARMDERTQKIEEGRCPGPLGMGRPGGIRGRFKARGMRGLFNSDCLQEGSTQ